MVYFKGPSLDPSCSHYSATKTLCQAIGTITANGSPIKLRSSQPLKTPSILSICHSTLTDSQLGKWASTPRNVDKWFLKIKLIIFVLTLGSPWGQTTHDEHLKRSPAKKILVKVFDASPTIKFNPEFKYSCIHANSRENIIKILPMILACQ